MNIEAIKLKVLEAINLRSDIIEDMKKCGIKSNFADVPEYNCFYGKIAENAELVIEYYYGAPSKIYTPIGYIRITGSYHTQEIPGAYKAFDNLLINKYGFKLAIEERVCSMGAVGPFYSKDGIMEMASEDIDYELCSDIFKSLI